MAQAKGRGKCILVLLLVAGMALLVLASLLLPWWSRMQFYDDAAEQAADRISRYERLIASKPLLEKQLAGLGRKIEQSGYFFRKGSPELAAAELQNRIKKMVGSAGGKLISTQNVGEPSEDPLQPIRIKVRMKGDVAALARVLHELSRASPKMIVESLSIRSRRTVKGRRKNRVEGYELDATLTIAGYLLEKRK